MMKAIFTREFHWRRPDGSLGFGAKASEEPQSFPRDFIEAAVNAGAATEIRSTSRKPAAERGSPTKGE